MPTLPTYQSQVSAQGPLGPGPTESGFGELIDAGQRLGAQLDHEATKERRRAVTRSMSEMRLAGEQGFL
jgi:hypothetical protein